ncbi:MAG: flippase-like domain-containing protein [Bacteroidales bacterium]|nr:flippase-like domain-containing protein [Bacteroidales bacterium]
MNKTLQQVLKITLCVVLAGLLLYLAFRKVSFKDVVDILKHANYWWLALSLSCGLLSYVCRSARWNLLIEGLGYKLKLTNTFNAVLSGYFINNAVPRLGEIMKCVALGRKESIPVDKLVGTMVAERTIDVLTLLVIAVALVLGASDSVNAFLRDGIFVPLQERIVNTFGNGWIFWTILVLLIVLMIALLVRYKDKLSKKKVFAKFYGFCNGLWDGLKVIFSLDKKWMFLLYTILMWALYTLMTWLVVFCLPSTSGLGLSDGIFLLVIGSLGMVVPVQSGFGAFHYITSRGLEYVYGIELEQGLAYALLSHESQILMMIIVGAIATYLIFGKKREKDPRL